VISSVKEAKTQKLEDGSCKKDHWKQYGTGQINVLNRACLVERLDAERSSSYGFRQGQYDVYEYVDYCPPNVLALKNFPVL
jgi:hypothetical protein